MVGKNDGRALRAARLFQIATSFCAWIATATFFLHALDHRRAEQGPVALIWMELPPSFRPGGVLFVDSTVRLIGLCSILDFRRRGYVADKTGGT
jgi:hypothetical protein